MMKLIACFLLLAHPLVFGTLDRIQRAMDKKEYDKAYELIIRGYEKEPDNAGISYYHAKLLFEKNYSGYNLDSARIIAEIALEQFESAPEELKSEIIEDGIPNDSIVHLHEKIRDRTIQEILSDMSIEHARVFQQKFPNSIYEDILVYKIDSMAYREARLSKSQSGLIKFIESYPTSVFKPKADSILDDMRFHNLIEDGGLKDYYAFHKEYPSTRHKTEVERYILKTSTASHSKKKYEDFIRFSDTGPLKKMAADVLYYLSGKEASSIYPAEDSLTNLRSLLNTELYPIVQNGRYGFFDRDGEKKIDPLYSGIASDYKCELTNDDWIFVNDKGQGLILTKDGKTILESLDGYQSICEDLAIVDQDGSRFLYHKSGFKIIEEPIEDAELISNSWIKVKRGDRWGLFTYMGLQVAEVIYDDIFKLGSFWVFQKNDLFAVYTKDLILSEIEDRGLSLEFKFDDLELVNSNALIGFREERECLLDSTLNFLIPWGNYEIYPDEAGWYLRSNLGYRLYNESEADLMDRHFPYLESNDGWLTLQTENGWLLIPRMGNLQPSLDYDSVKLINNFAALLIKDGEKTLQFTSGEEISLGDHHIRTFQNHEEYVSIQEDETMSIFNKLGEKVISGKFQSASFANDSLIKVQVRNKQGLIHIEGDWVLNPVFNSIDEKDGLVLTLFDGKIGCYDPTTNELITAEYEARIERLGNNYLAKKEGKFGLIDPLKNEVLSFSYDQITFWNDTSYLVEKEGQFSLINRMEEPVYESVESMRHLLSNEQHTIYRFVRNGKYGLISNHFGELLSAEFTDIFNIGSEASPLIFADQHLDKAGFHVVSYVNEKGQLIHSKAYTSEEFERILCDE